MAESQNYKYIITARIWTDRLEERFGSEKTRKYNPIKLSDSEIVKLIIEFGRAQIDINSNGVGEIDFQNDYQIT